MNFWDSSALVALLVRDDAVSQGVRTVLERDPAIFVSWLAALECIAALTELRRSGVIGAEGVRQAEAALDRLARSWSEIKPGSDLLERTRRLLSEEPEHPLHVVHALQLAAALLFYEDDPNGAGFVTLDRRLRVAAQAHGFTVLP